MKKKELLARIEALEARVADLEMMRNPFMPSPQEPWGPWPVTCEPPSGIRPGAFRSTSGTRLDQWLER